MTTWRKIEGYPRYSVSEDGQVRNDITGKILTPHADSNGYLSVGLYRDDGRNTKRVHKLVAEAFIPNPDNLPDVNHIDGNKSNNNKDNLEHCTRSYNMLHSSRTLGKKSRKSYVKPILCIETGIVYPTVKAAAEAVDRSSMAIRKCLYGWTKTSAGLHWRDAV